MKRLFVATLAVGLVLGVPAARAHHSFAAIYDFTKPITVTGKVSLDTAPRTVEQTIHRLPDSELIGHICEDNDKFEEQIGSGAQR